mmetsp:Transcript_15963/g.50817  ORF Transcript_15963/g.50817 Transcript_15963/m.50817 type:complete len:997 (+) Transcript_15963:56-3046(+)
MPVEAYVALLGRGSTRAIIGATAVFLTLLGGMLYSPFNASLIVSVEPTPDSPSGVARTMYNRYFPPDPVQLIVLTKAKDGGAIVNLSAALDINISQPLKKWISFNSSTELTGEAAGLSHALKQVVSDSLSLKCRYSFMSYFDVGLARSHAGTHDRPLHDLLDDVIQLAAQPQLFNKHGDTTLSLIQVEECHGNRIDAACVGKETRCEPVVGVMHALRSYIRAHPAGSPVVLELVSFPSVFEAIQQGVDTAMLISTLSVVPAFVLLGLVLRNLRLLLITLLNIAVAVSSSIVVMYPIAAATKVSSEAPALMVASGLALSIDYSLFLLTRFGEEVQAGASLEEALVVTLQTSGHTVLISGSTLFLCFLGMLLIPVSTISTMGIAAASTVVFAIVGALTITPSLLLTFPDFFTSRRRFGLTCDGISACSRLGCAPRGGGRKAIAVADEPHASLSAREPMLASAAVAVRVAPRAADASGSGEPTVQPLNARVSLPEAPQTHPAALVAPSEGPANRPVVVAAGGWAKLGRLTQRFWWLFLPLLLAAAAPFCAPALELTYVEGVLSLLPRGEALTGSFLELQANFGVTAVFPSTVVILPPAPVDLSQRHWLNASCHAMQRVGRQVTEEMRAHGRASGDGILSHYTMDASDFSGVMIQGGLCTGILIELLETPLAKQWGDMLIDAFANAERTATKVKVTTTLDPFSTIGQKWISAMRDALDANQMVVLDPSFPGEPVLVGEMHLTGMAEEQMDGAAATFVSLPRVIALTLLIVMCVIGAAFKSVLVPIRAVLCLMWMLVVTFGAAVLVYQSGVLESSGLRPFTVSPAPPAPHALFWMSPCIAFSILVGLGLDYDVFFMESVVEHYDHGHSARDAVVLALNHTGNIICVAGVIMFLAFGALLLGSTPILNQIGFLLCLGILIDCFVSTKIIIPCAMALLDVLPGNANFWPRKPLRAAEPDPVQISRVSSRRMTLAAGTAAARQCLTQGSAASGTGSAQPRNGAI